MKISLLGKFDWFKMDSMHLLFLVKLFLFCQAIHADSVQQEIPIVEQKERVILNTIFCNNTNERLPVPQHQTFHPQHSFGNYFLPTILNYAPSKIPSSSSDEMDMGDRIQPPFSNLHMRPTGVLFRPRLPPNHIRRDVEKMNQVESRAKFYLFTRRNPVESQELIMNGKASLNGSQFNPELETKLIFHGFTDIDAPGEWVNLMKATYLGVADVNVIVADYSWLSLSDLLHSSSLPVFTSKQLSEFIAFLTSGAGMSLDSLHVIARSYACHIVGMGGRKLDGKIGRITALEPSPKISVMDGQEFKLKKSDAGFVDVVHVNGHKYFFHGQQFGLIQSLGHVDVYPHISERGLGCVNENVHFRRFHWKHCSPGRGVTLFTKSLRYTELFPMCRCRSYEMYKDGFCSCREATEMTYLGHISNATQGVYQLAPNTHVPTFSHIRPSFIF